MWHHPIDQPIPEEFAASPSEWKYGYYSFTLMLAAAMALAYFGIQNLEGFEHGSFKEREKARTTNISTTNAMLAANSFEAPQANETLNTSALKVAEQAQVRVVKHAVKAPTHFTAPVPAPKQEPPKTQPKRNVTGAF